MLVKTYGAEDNPNGTLQMCKTFSPFKPQVLTMVLGHIKMVITLT